MSETNFRDFLKQGDEEPVEEPATTVDDSTDVDDDSTDD